MMNDLAIHGLLEAVATRTRARDHAPNSFNAANLLLTNEAGLSRVIGWMLDPAGTHGEGDRYLRRFLDLCKVKVPENCGAARVRLEVPRYAAGKLVGRIDIQITHPGFLLLVENKPTARFGDKQLERYTRSLPTDSGGQARVVTLLGDGWDDAFDRTIERAGTCVLKLGTDIRDWIAECQRVTTAAKVCTFLGDLEADLDQRYAGRDARNVRQVINLLTASPQSVAASITIVDAYDALVREMNERVGRMVEERARAMGLGGLRPVLGEAPLISPSRNSMLRLDIGDPRFDFALSAEATYFRNVALGVCLRDEKRGMQKVYVNEIAKLRTALGAGQSDLDNWWLWWDHVQSMDAGADRSVAPPDLWAWAADESDTGLAAAFVKRASEAKSGLAASTDT